MASVTNYFARVGAEEYQSSLFKHGDRGKNPVKRPVGLPQRAYRAGVSLVLRGEAVAQIRIPHVLLNVVARNDTHKSPLVFHHVGFAHLDPVPL